MAGILLLNLHGPFNTLAGAGESGKSTVLKQIKLIHKLQMPPDELKQCSDSLKANAAECMQLLLEQVAAFGYEFPNEEEKVRCAAFPISADRHSEFGCHCKQVRRCIEFDECGDRRRDRQALEDGDDPKDVPSPKGILDSGFSRLVSCKKHARAAGFNDLVTLRTSCGSSRMTFSHQKTTWLWHAS